MNDTEMQFLSLKQILEYSNSIEFIVLPGYFLDSDNSEFCLAAYLNNKLLIANERVDSMINKNKIQMGSLVTIYLDCDEIKVASIKTFNFKGKPRLGMHYNPATGINAIRAKKTKLYQGQSIIIRGSHGSGKTTVAKRVADGFEKNDFKTYRVSFAQRKEDSLGENTLKIQSLGPKEYQLKSFFIILHSLFRDIHEGVDCCLIIDSIDKLILIDGESERKLRTTLNFTHRLLRFAGDFNIGSLTIVSTSEIGNTHISRRLGVELKSFSDAELFLGKFAANGELDYSRHS